MRVIREERRRDLYRPGADMGTVARYLRPRRRTRWLVVAAVLVLAAGVVTLPLLQPPATPAQIGPRIRGSIAGPEAFASVAAARAALPRIAATAHGSGEGRVVVNLDRFGQVIGPGSRFVVLVACSGGRFDLRLSTVTQARSQILLAPLRAASGPCTGVQRIRYRPLLGLIPTAVEVEAQGEVRILALLTR